MHTPRFTPKAGSYATLLLFVVGGLLGGLLLPRLSVQLHPQTSGSQLSLRVGWAGASPEAMERQVTSLIEGVCSAVQGVTKVSSTTGYGSATIRLQLDKKAAPDRLRFEVAQRIRQVYPNLPAGVQYPILTLNAPEETGGRRLFMTLQVNGSGTAQQLTQLAETFIKPRLAQLNALHSVQVYGQAEDEWHLRYDETKLAALGLTREALLQRLIQLASPTALGKAYATAPSLREALLSVSVPAVEASSAQQLPLNQAAERIVSLSDLLEWQTVPPRSERYFRLNGRTAVQLVLVTRADANQLVASEAVREVLRQLGPHLPPDHGIRIEYDAADYLRENLSRMAVQSGAALALLILMVLLSVRRIKYSLLILWSLAVNLLLSVVAFYLFGVTLHLYSLAALTVSLGLLVDNSIVMIDHYGRYRNRRVLTALLGATLTTWAALSVIWFLPEQTRHDLSEFGLVLLITLGTSLLVAHGFVPACMEQWRMVGNTSDSSGLSRRSWSFRLDRLYARATRPLVRFRVLLLLLALAGFGIPLFMLPKKLPDTMPQRLADWYEQTIGSAYYQERLRPSLDKTLGGALRLFVNFVYERGYYNSQERTVLYVNAGLPTSSTPEQMNQLLLQMEEELKKHQELDRFVTEVYSGQQGGITIYFKKAQERTGFPFRLKGLLIARSVETSGVDWNIYGVGQGFSQRVNDQAQTSFNIQLRGYQYAELERWAETLAERLLRHPRIQEVDINRVPGGWSQKNVYLYTLTPDLYDLSQRGVALRELQEVLLTRYNSRPQPDFYWPEKGLNRPVVLKALQEAGAWEMQQRPIALAQQRYQLPSSSSLTRARVLPEIRKEDQQYIRQVSYEYLGNYTFGAKNQKQVLDLFKGDLPPGYSVREAGMFDWWGQSGQRSYGLVALVLVLIFLLGAILFESLRQAATLIALVLLSFTGVFLVFYWTEINFDQGGYASFLLVAGLSVNAFLFIIHEYNYQRREWGLSSPRAYRKAIRYKIRPILLSIFTTVVGLLPFLWEAHEQAFWPALALGTMGGMIASLIVLLLLMPCFMVRKAYFR